MPRTCFASIAIALLGGCSFLAHDTYLVTSDPAIAIEGPRTIEDSAPTCLVRTANDSVVYEVQGPLDWYAVTMGPFVPPLPILPNVLLPVQLWHGSIGREGDVLIFIQVDIPADAMVQWRLCSATSSDGLRLDPREIHECAFPERDWRSGLAAAGAVESDARVVVFFASRRWQPPLDLVLPPVSYHGATIPGPAVRLVKKSKWRFRGLVQDTVVPSTPGLAALIANAPPMTPSPRR